MSEAVIVALISGIVTLIGTVLTVRASSRKTQNKVEVELAVVNTEIKELTREVREHNGFAQRMPVCEEQIRNLAQRVSVMEAKSHG